MVACHSAFPRDCLGCRFEVGRGRAGVGRGSTAPPTPPRAMHHGPIGAVFVCFAAGDSEHAPAAMSRRWDMANNVGLGLCPTGWLHSTPHIASPGKDTTTMLETLVASRPYPIAGCPG